MGFFCFGAHVITGRLPNSSGSRLNVGRLVELILVFASTPFQTSGFFEIRVRVCCSFLYLCVFRIGTSSPNEARVRSFSVGATFVVPAAAKFLLVLASTVILDLESREIHALSRIRCSPTWTSRSPYLYPQGTMRLSYIPRYWFPFSSPPTTRRATVEIFEPASTRGSLFTHVHVTAQMLPTKLRNVPRRKHLLHNILYCLVVCSLSWKFTYFRCLAKTVSSRFTISALSHYVTIFWENIE
jgi:hypothetical protein